MPVITVQMFEGRTVDQKRALAEAFTKAFCEIAKAQPEAVEIIFDEVSRQNWAHAGKLASDNA
jgi:4-oxalocrotonate tautomerase